MEIQLHLHGILAEIAGKHCLEFNESMDTANLRKSVEASYPSMKSYIYRIAVNDRIIQEDINLKDGDDVHFIPPFPGG